MCDTRVYCMATDGIVCLCRDVSYTALGCVPLSVGVAWYTTPHDSAPYRATLPEYMTHYRTYATFPDVCGCVV